VIVKSTVKPKRVGPLSVQLPPDLKRRLGAQAAKRRLKVATAARVFLDEHMSELEGAAELSAAEEWQRAQAWPTWDKIKAGDLREATVDELHQVVDRVRQRLKPKVRSR
jgi:hypothetical protein